MTVFRRLTGWECRPDGTVGLDILTDGGVRRVYGHATTPPATMADIPATVAGLPAAVAGWLDGVDADAFAVWELLRRDGTLDTLAGSLDRGELDRLDPPRNTGLIVALPLGGVMAGLLLAALVM